MEGEPGEPADEEGDVEEEIVLVNLNGLPNPGLINQIMGPCYVLGIDSDSPVIQVGDFVFKGRYEDILGTGLLFEHSNGSGKLSDGGYKFIGKSSKRLSVTRTIIKKIQHEEPLEDRDEEPLEDRHCKELLEDRHKEPSQVEESETPMETEDPNITTQTTQ